MCVGLEKAVQGRGRRPEPSQDREAATVPVCPVSGVGEWTGKWTWLMRLEPMGMGSFEAK